MRPWAIAYASGVFSGIKWGTSSSHKHCTTTCLHSPTITTLQSMQGRKNTLSTPTHTETNNRPSHSADAPLRQALGRAVNSQTSKSLNHGVREPTSFSEITVAEAHGERGREDPEATEKRHLALLTQGTHLFCAHEHCICGRGRCQDSKPRVFRIHSGNLSPVQGKRKMPKNRELAAEIRAR